MRGKREKILIRYARNIRLCERQRTRLKIITEDVFYSAHLSWSAANIRNSPMWDVFNLVHSIHCECFLSTPFFVQSRKRNPIYLKGIDSNFICWLRCEDWTVFTACSWCARVLGWPFSQNTGSWATEPWPRCFEDGEMQWGRCNRMQGRLIWIQIFAITDFIMFSLMWRSPQIAGLVFSIQVTFADNFYTQIVMLFDAAGFSENPTLCSALSPPGFYFPLN